MKNFSGKTRAFFIILCAISLIVLIISWVSGYHDYVAFSTVFLFVSLAFYFMIHPSLKKFSFTIWVFAFVAASMFYPFLFDSWAGINLAILIVPLIQIIMFGMGTTLSIDDFTRVLKMPKPVLLGLVLQFTVMPLTALLISFIFNFEPEVSAGIILVGSCPGGVASNLMTYLAGGNVALSVTMTSCSTMASPIMTPFLMKTLAGELVPVDFITMMMSILNMIIVPIVAGIVANKILYGTGKWFLEKHYLLYISIILILIGIFAGYIKQNFFGILSPLKHGIVLGFVLLGTVAFVKYIMSVILKKDDNWMDKTLPIVSMFSICFIIAIITARSSEKLLSIGLLLISASILHNLVGYLLGYWLAKVSNLDEKSSRTVAFEVGMQNGGMATGLAMNVLKSASAALPPAIFGPWMNISGSVLATWWKRKKVDEL